MKNLHYLFLFLLIISCEKDDYQNPFDILSINYSDDGSILIEWENIEVDDFKHYEILRSTDGKDFEIINNVDSLSSSAYDISITKFKDYSYPLRKVLYYKVAIAGSKYMTSNKVSFNVPLPISLDISPTNAFIMTEDNQLFLYQDALSEINLCLYNYENNNVIYDRNLDLKYTGYAYGHGKYDNEYEFYFFDNDWGSYNVQIFDINMFVEKSSVRLVDNSDKNIITDVNGNIYYTFFSKLYIASRETDEVNSYICSLGSSIQDIQYHQDLNCIFGVGIFEPKIFKFQLDNESDIIEETYHTIESGKTFNLIGNSNFGYTNNVDSDTYGNDIELINHEDWTTQILLDENNDTVSFSTFYYKNDLLYATGKYLKKIYCYSIDKLELEKVIPVRIYPNFIFIDERNNMILIEADDYIKRCEIDKIKLLD